jgi:uncharacterized membrane protein
MIGTRPSRWHYLLAGLIGVVAGALLLGFAGWGLRWIFDPPSPYCTEFGCAGPALTGLLLGVIGAVLGPLVTVVGLAVRRRRHAPTT